MPDITLLPVTRTALQHLLTVRLQTLRVHGARCATAPCPVAAFYVPASQVVAASAQLTVSRLVFFHRMVSLSGVRS